MPEHPCYRARKSQSKNERRMVFLVAENQATGAHQRRQIQTVCSEAHAEYYSVFDSQEPGGQWFQLVVDRHISWINEPWFVIKLTLALVPKRL